MIALGNAIRKTFLPAFLLAGLIPLLWTHWVPGSGSTSNRFTLPVPGVLSQGGTGSQKPPRHKTCWRAEDSFPRVQESAAQGKSPEIGEAFVYHPGSAGIRPCASLFSRAPAVLSILRI